MTDWNSVRPKGCSSTLLLSAMKIAIDWFEDGRQLFKQGKPCPNWDGTGPTSYVIDGWRQSAKEAKVPGYECTCVSFDCPYH